NTAGPSPSASNRFHKMLSRSSRGPFTRRCTAWSSRPGSRPNGARPRPGEWQSSTPLRVRDVSNWKGNWQTGLGCRRPSTSCSRRLSNADSGQSPFAASVAVLPSECRLRTRSRTSFPPRSAIEETISSGLPLEEARRAAQRMIGRIAQYKEECREMRRVDFVEDLVQDVRYTIRSLAKSPGFTGVVVATLALGIGANIAIFTIVHGVLLRPLDYPKPDQLMYLTAEAPAIGSTGGALSAPEYVEFRQMNGAFAAVGAYSTGGTAYTTGEVNLTVGDRPLRVRSISVDAHLLKALGIQPEQGRFFSDQETARWAGTLPPPIAILSHELWRTAFGGRPPVGQK